MKEDSKIKLWVSNAFISRPKAKSDALDPRLLPHICREEGSTYTHYNNSLDMEVLYQ